MSTKHIFLLKDKLSALKDTSLIIISISVINPNINMVNNSNNTKYRYERSQITN